MTEAHPNCHGLLYPDPAPPSVRGRGEARGSLSRFGNLAKGAIGAVISAGSGVSNG